MGLDISKKNLVGELNQLMSVATNPQNTPAKRKSALLRIEAYFHQRELCKMCQAVLSEVQHVNELLALLGSRQLEVCLAGFRLCQALTSTNDAGLKISIGKRLLEDLLEMLQRVRNLDPRIQELLVLVIANLLTEDTCRNEIEYAESKDTGGVGEIILLLNHPRHQTQLASLKALTAISERSSGRQLIVSKGILNIVGLCFVSTLWGQIRAAALRLLANLSKEEAVRSIIGPQGVMFRLSEAIKSTSDPILTQLVASVYANFSPHDDLIACIDPKTITTMLYSLVFSPRLDIVVQGLWALANCLRDASMRVEFIETDGLKLILAVLKQAPAEPLIWYEVARAIASVAGGGPQEETGTDEEKEYLIREGCIEAIKVIYDWCSVDSAKDKQDDNDVDRAEVEDEPISYEHLYNTEGEDVAYSARYIVMTMCTRALKHLTTFGYVCQLVCELGCIGHIMHVLKADYDTEGQLFATAVVANLALHPESCKAVVQGDAVGSLVDLLLHSTHRMVHHQACAAVANIGRMGVQNLRAIIEAGGPAALIKVLTPDDCPVETAVHAIRALGMLESNEAKFEIMNSGGLRLIIRYVSYKSTELKKVCAIALRNLAELNDDSHQLVMAKDGALVSLVALLRETHMEILRDATKAITILTGKMESNRIAFLEQDGHLEIIRHLSTTDDELLVQVLSVIGNLGTLIEGDLDGSETIVRQLCYILQMDRFALTLQAMRCLAALTKRESSARIILTLVPAAMLIDMVNSPNAALQRHSLCVLSNLALIAENRVVLREAAFMTTLESLFSSESFDLVLLTVQCIGNMLLEPSEEDYETHDNLVQLLAEIANKAVGIMAESSKPTSSTTAYIANRNLLMLQSALSALKIYAMTGRGQSMLVQKFGCLQMFLDCLENQSLEVRRDAARCLAYITSEDTCRVHFIAEGGTDKTVSALRAAAACAAEVERDLMEICGKIKVDTRLKNGGFAGPDASHAEMAKIGLTYEERELLMNQMDGLLKMREQNSVLQAACLDIIYHIAYCTENQKMLLEAYDWKVFMQPFDVPTTECQTSAATTCFKMLQCGVALHRFIELKGVSQLLRALELEDSRAKQLAAQGLGQLSNTDPHSFRRAILDEGGVGMIMTLTGSVHHSIRTQAFAAVAQLCTNKGLGEVFVSQNVLQAIQVFSSRCRHEVSTYLSLVTAIGHLAGNEAIRWKVLEKGGASLLFRSLTHQHLSVAKAASNILVKLLSPEIDVREGLARCKMSPAIVECINIQYDQEVLRNVLKTLSYMVEREAYAEKIGTPALVDALLMLTDDAEREKELADRQAQTEEKIRANVRDGKLHTQDEPEVPEVSKANKTLNDGLVSGALSCLKHLLPIPGLLDHLVQSKEGLRKVVRSAAEKSSLERIAVAVSVIKIVLTRPEAHKALIDEGVLLKMSFLTKVQHTETKLAIAQCLETLSIEHGKEFTGSKVCKGLKNLLLSSVRDVQMSCCTILINAFTAGVVELASMSAMTDLLKYVETDTEPLQLKALEAIRLLCPEMKKWFESPVLKEKEAAIAECEPAPGKVMSAYRRSLQRSMLASHALHTTAALLSCCPQFMCRLIDSVMVLDLKRAAMQKGLPSLTPPPKLMHGKASIDAENYSLKGKDFPGKLINALASVHAARCLCYMSCTDDTTTMVSFLKALTVEDLVKTAYNAYTEGGDSRTIVLMLRITGNCAIRGTQKYQLADDKTGLLKMIFALCSHTDPYVVQAALFTLARVAEEPSGHNRMLAMASFDALVRLCKGYVNSLIDIDKLVNGSVKKFDSGPTAVLSMAITDLCKLMSNLSDGGSAALRSLTEAADSMRDLFLMIPKQLPPDAKLYISSALCAVDSKPPESIFGIAASFADFIEAALDRIDTNRVLKGVTGLCTLSKDPLNHQELVEEGGIKALCVALRNPVPAVFRSACWALCYLAMGGCRDSYDPVGRDKTAKERAKYAESRLALQVAIHKKILDEGVAAAVKIAIVPKQSESKKIASKLIALLLRHPEAPKHLVQCGYGQVFTQFRCPSF